MARPSSISSLVMTRGGSRRSRSPAVRHSRPCVDEQGGQFLVGPGALYINAQHEAQAHNIPQFRAADGLDARPEVGALLPDLVQEGLVHGLQHRQARGSGDGVGSEGGAVGSRGKDPGALLVGEDTTQGQAAGDPLGEGDHIRLDAELLEGEQAAGAADAGLDLVHQQQPVLLPAQGGQGLDHGDLQGAQAALPLDEFYHDRAHVVPRLGLDALQIVGVGVAEGLVEREEIVVIALLPGGGEGGDGPPMEGAVQGENGAAALAVLIEAVLPGQL